MRSATPKILGQQLDRILDEPWLDNLWTAQDGGTKDYGEVFTKHTGLEVTRVKRRPLAFIVRSPDFPEALYEVQCARNCNRWRRLS